MDITIEFVEGNMPEEYEDPCECCNGFECEECIFDEEETFTFKELFADFVAGTPIKRKAWKGYWVYKYGRIEMHTKSGVIVDFLDTDDILFTISGILQDDWEYAEID